MILQNNELDILHQSATFNDQKWPPSWSARSLSGRAPGPVSDQSPRRRRRLTGGWREPAELFGLSPSAES